MMKATEAEQDVLKKPQTPSQDDGWHQEDSKLQETAPGPILQFAEEAEKKNTTKENKEKIREDQHGMHYSSSSLRRCSIF
jgi:hypothetical protein